MACRRIPLSRLLVQSAVGWGLVCSGCSLRERPAARPSTVAGPSESGTPRPAERREPAIVSELRKANADRLAEPIIVRTLCPSVPEAKALHFTYSLQVLTPDVCKVRIRYKEHRTDMSRVWAEETVVVDYPDLRLVPPQRTIRGYRYEFAVTARRSKVRGLPSPVVRVYMKSSAIGKERDHIRRFKPNRVAVLTDSNVWDLRVLRDIAAFLKLGTKASSVVSIYRLTAESANPWILIVDIVVGKIVSVVADGVAKEFGKVYIRSIHVHCGLCGKQYDVRKPANGQRIVCTGCGATATVHTD